MLSKRGDLGIGPNAFFRKFAGAPHVTCSQNGREFLLGNPVPVLFREHNSQPWTYFLIVGSRSETSKVFKVDANWRGEASEDREHDAVEFKVELPGSIGLAFRFKGRLETQEAAEFRTILARLIYQTRARKSYRDCADPREIEGIIPFRHADPQRPDTRQRILEVFAQLKGNQQMEFAVVGSFWKIEMKAEGQEGAELVFREAILAVTSPRQFEYFVLIVDENGTEKCKLQIDNKMTYFFDYAKGFFYWSDVQLLGGFCLAMAMHLEELAALEMLWLQVVLESQNKEAFERFVANTGPEWQQMYGTGRMEVEEHEVVRDMPQVDGILEFSLIEHEVTMIDAPAEEDNSVHQHLIQSRLSRMAMASRGNKLDMYAFDGNQDIMKFVGNTKLSENRDVAPAKIELLEKQGKVAFLDRLRNDSIFISDLERGKVVSQFGQALRQNIRDFGVTGGKNSLETGQGELTAVTLGGTVKIDPRIPTGIADVRNYRSRVDFDKVVTVRNDCFAVASMDGVIRTYSGVGDNARNVIPSFMGDKILSLDTTKDGKYLLANCGRYLMLFNTVQGGTDAYSTMFRKDNKPVPRILKVHPTVLSRLHLNDLIFSQAKFDERRNGLERAIIASNEHVVAIWSLEKVGRGELTTSEVKRIDERVVQADFKYDDEEIITAHPTRLGLQRVGKRK